MSAAGLLARQHRCGSKPQRLSLLYTMYMKQTYVATQERRASTVGKEEIANEDIAKRAIEQLKDAEPSIGCLNRIA